MSYDYVKTWRKNTKKRLLEAFGSQCCICGYSKCEGALHFHHLDPKSKDFTIGQFKILNWDKIVEEVRKCICVCCRCHAEIHAGITDVPVDVTRFNEEYSEYRDFRGKDTCPICKNLKFIENKTCSIKCFAKFREKIDWDKVNLKQLIEVEQLTYRAIAKKLGVSDMAVRKRAYKLKLQSVASKIQGW